jgi:hypothetical protein
MTEYKTYIKKEEGLKQDQEIELAVEDIETMETRVARAILSRFPQVLPGADRLWLYDFEGHRTLLDSNPWSIKVIEWVEEEVKEIRIRSRRDGIIRSLLRERDEKG